MTETAVCARRAVRMDRRLLPAAIDPLRLRPDGGSPRAYLNDAVPFQARGRVRAAAGIVAPPQRGRPAIARGAKDGYFRVR